MGYVTLGNIKRLYALFLAASLRGPIGFPLPARTRLFAITARFLRARVIAARSSARPSAT
jgi:hypothetical protein